MSKQIEALEKAHEALKLALAALKRIADGESDDPCFYAGESLEAIEQAIAKPVPEPDCWAILTPNGSRLVSPDEAKGRKDAYPLYTAPPAAQPAPVAWQDKAKPSELVVAEGWDNIDPQWHWMYRPFYTTPPAAPVTTNCRHCGGPDNVLCAGQCNTAAQPAVPLTPEWIGAFVEELRDTPVPGTDFGLVELVVRKVEAAHGITKGGAA
jgi:hypothetical protein